MRCLPLIEETSIQTVPIPLQQQTFIFKLPDSLRQYAFRNRHLSSHSPGRCLARGADFRQPGESSPGHQL